MWRNRPRAQVVHCGLLYGHRVYLVAAFPRTDEPVNYRLDRMSDVRVSGATGTRPHGFNLDAYAARSFGVFQEEPHDVVLRFIPRSSRRRSRGLPVPSNADPHPRVIHNRPLPRRRPARNRMAFVYLGDALRIVEPEQLKELMQDLLERSQRSVSP